LTEWNISVTVFRMDAPGITGFGHIDLTVADAKQSAEWWERVLGFNVVNVMEGANGTYYSMLHPCGVAVIARTPSQLVTDRFDDRAIGLDHLAFAVADRETLEAWARHLDSCGVAHSGLLEENGGPVLVFRDPDNIQLEFHAIDLATATMNRA
jgi:catechol 2,3-dioxygenase-like lactoylglutathione lyase family enzyme